jgi:hypothetical protein
MPRNSVRSPAVRVLATWTIAALAATRVPLGSRMATAPVADSAAPASEAPGAAKIQAAATSAIRSIATLCQNLDTTGSS